MDALKVVCKLTAKVVVKLLAANLTLYEVVVQSVRSDVTLSHEQRL